MVTTSAIAELKPEFEVYIQDEWIVLEFSEDWDERYSNEQSYHTIGLWL